MGAGASADRAYHKVEPEHKKMLKEQETVVHSSAQYESESQVVVKKQKMLEDLQHEIAELKKIQPAEEAFVVSNTVKATQDFRTMDGLIVQLTASVSSNKTSLDVAAASIKAKLEHIEREKALLKKQLDEQTGANKSLEESYSFKISTAVKQKKEVDDEKSVALKGKAEAETQFNIAKADRDAAQKAIDDAQKSSQQSIDEENIKHKNASDSAEKARAELEQRLLEKDKQADEASKSYIAQIQKLQQSFIESKKQSEERQKGLKDKIGQLSQEKSQIQSKIGQSEALLKQIQSTLQTEITTLTKRFTDTTTSRDSYAEQIKKVKQDSVTKTGELKGQIQQLTTDRDSAKKQLDTVSTEVSGLQTKLKGLEDENKAFTLSLEMFIREVGTFTNGQNSVRITSTDKYTNDKGAAEAVRKMLDVYMGTRQGNLLSISDFCSFIDGFDMMKNITMPSIIDLFKNATAAFIGYIEILCCFKDMQELQGHFLAATRSQTLSRNELRDLFTKVGTNFHLPQYAMTFNAIVSHCDKSNDDKIQRDEFMKVAGMLEVLRFLYSQADLEQNGRLSLEEVKKLLESCKCDNLFVGKVISAFNDFTEKPPAGSDQNAPKQAVAFEGFVGVMLSNMKLA